MIYLLMGTWLIGAYAIGWYRGRQGWPFLWRVAAKPPVSRETPRTEPKPVVLPADEPDKMLTRLKEQVPGFATAPPNVQAGVIARLRQRAEDELGMRTHP